jgi:hypothetical protein
MVIIAACSSSAHQLPDLLSDRCYFLPVQRAIQLGCSAASNAMPGHPPRKDTQPAVRS